MKDATFRQIEVFEAVARHRNYSRAAQELHMSQPGVSIHIKQLERHAGLPLVEQVGKKIFLTPAGQEMLRYGRVIIQQFKETHAALAEMKDVRRGCLNVAVISAGDYFFPGLVAEFCQRHENVTVRLTVKNRDETVRHLVENSTDLGVLLHPPDNPDIVAEPFAPQPLVIIAPPGHKLAGRRHMSMQELAGEPFIVRETGSDTRLTLDEWLAEFSVQLNIIMEVQSTETIKHAVMSGLGLGFLSAHTVGQELALGRLAVLDVEGCPVMRRWHVVHHKNKHLPPVAAAFKEFLLQEGAAQIERLIERPCLGQPASA